MASDHGVHGNWQTGQFRQTDEKTKRYWHFDHPDFRPMNLYLAGLTGIWILEAAEKVLSKNRPSPENWPHFGDYVKSRLSEARTAYLSDAQNQEWLAPLGVIPEEYGRKKFFERQAEARTKDRKQAEFNRKQRRRFYMR